jgi:hypothetical protein
VPRWEGHVEYRGTAQRRTAPHGVLHRRVVWGLYLRADAILVPGTPSPLRPRRAPIDPALHSSRLHPPPSLPAHSSTSHRTYTPLFRLPWPPLPSQFLNTPLHSIPPPGAAGRAAAWLRSRPHVAVHADLLGGGQHPVLGGLPPKVLLGRERPSGGEPRGPGHAGMRQLEALPRQLHLPSE